MNRMRQPLLLIAATAVGIILAGKNVRAAGVESHEVDGPGGRGWLLKNDSITVQISPSAGGTITAAMLNRNSTNLVYPVKPGYGLLRDQIWEPHYNFGADAYSAQPVNENESVGVKLTTTGKGGMFSFLDIEKTVTLEESESRIRVSYKVKNNPASFTNYEFGFWVHNYFGVSGETNTYYTPTETGVQSFLYDGKKSAAPECWYRDPSRGWIASVSSSGKGIAARVEYKKINSFYYYFGAAVSTAEWRYNLLEIPAGEALETNVEFLPFDGLSRIDGVFDGGVASIDAESGSANVAGCISQSVSAVVSIRTLPAADWTKISRIPIRLSPAQTQTIPLGKLDLPDHATTVVRLEFYDGQKFLGDAERVVDRGQTAQKYQFPPRERRIGKAGLAANDAGAEKKLSMNRVTPHVQLARPLANGPIKVLFISDENFARHIIEIAQRFDLDFDYSKFCWVNSDTAYKWYGDTSVGSLAAARLRLAEKLKNNYNVIVVCGIDWSRHFTPQIQQSIIEKVKTGTGLVCIAPVGVPATAEAIGIPAQPTAKADFEDVDFLDNTITHAIDSRLMPGMGVLKYERVPGEVCVETHKSKLPVIARTEHDRSRVVCFLWDGFTRGYENTLVGGARMLPVVSDWSNGNPRGSNARISWRWQDAPAALLGRAMLWCAHRDSACEVTSIDPTPEGVNVVFGGKDAAQAAAVEVVLGACSGEDEMRVISSAGPNNFLKWTAQPAYGGHQLDVIIKNKEGAVLAFGSSYYQVQSPVHIVALSSDAGIVPASERKVSGKVTIDGEAPGEIQILVHDYFGRLIGRQSLEKKIGIQNFSIELLDTLSLSVRITAEVKSVNGIVDRKQVSVVLKKPVPRNDFLFANWYARPVTDGVDFQDGAVREISEFTDVIMDLSSFFENGHVQQIYENNMRFTPLNLGRIHEADYKGEKAKYIATKDKKYLIRNPSLADPQFKRVSGTSVANAVRNSLKYGGARDFCLGDEMSLSSYTDYFDYDYSEQSLEGFREWLKKDYKSLERLNEQWGSNFTDWKAVMPATLDEVRGKANASAWGDFRTYMETQVADFFAYCQAQAQEADPEARVSMSGTQNPAAGNGIDWWKIYQALPFENTYNTAFRQNLIHNSFARAQEKSFSPYNAGYTVSGMPLRSNMFDALFSNASGITAWCQKSMFNMDLTLNDAGRDTKDVCLEFKNGLWRLLKESERTDECGIAVHYSQVSIHAAGLLGKEDRFADNRTAIATAIEDLGYRFNYLAYEQIESGALLSGGYKVLVLPQSLALSPKECAEIRKFVDAGGSIIADASCALFDQHCRAYQTPALNDLFGIKSSEHLISAEPGISFLEALGEHCDSTHPFRIGVVERIELSTAKALGISKGGNPAILVNSSGKGKAYYLNIPLNQYTIERNFATVTEKQFRDVLGYALAQSGVRTPATITNEDQSAPHYRVSSYIQNKTKYLGILFPYNTIEKDKTAVVKLREEAHVFDVRNGKYLGHVKELRIPMKSGAAVVLALMPSADFSVDVSLAEVTLRPGDAVHWSASIKSAGQNDSTSDSHLLRLEVVDPSGHVLLHYRDFVWQNGKPVSGSFHLALNDPPGEWIVRIVDVASSTHAECKFTVKN